DDQVRDWYFRNFSEIARELVNTFELGSYRGRDQASNQLCTLAKRASEALGREVSRGNKWIDQILPECTTWPSMFSPHPKIQKALTAELQEKGIGSKALPSRDRVQWERGAKMLVLTTFEYCETLNSETEWWKESKIHPSECIPDLVKEIWKLPRPLSPNNWKSWRKVGYKVLSHATGGLDREHPAFENEPLKDLETATDDWTDQISQAWKIFSETRS
ncbi:hypothetical protein N9Z83_01590, partial [Akkermansiaceae bacterium]|nr:hypothetical protein [Akkermansiaceae bacterium]